MATKRKTRKQKEKTTLRKATTVAPNTEVGSTPIYTIASPSINTKTEQNKSYEASYSKSGLVYLKQDIRHIVAAGGIVIAFDILLYVLLQTGLLKFPFLGY